MQKWGEKNNQHFEIIKPSMLDFKYSSICVICCRSTQWLVRGDNAGRRWWCVCLDTHYREYQSMHSLQYNRREMGKSSWNAWITVRKRVGFAEAIYFTTASICKDGVHIHINKAVDTSIDVLIMRNIAVVQGQNIVACMPRKYNTVLLLYNNWINSCAFIVQQKIIIWQHCWSQRKTGEQARNGYAFMEVPVVRKGSIYSPYAIEIDSHNCLWSKGSRLSSKWAHHSRVAII